jgi:hypothetical protein
MTSSFINDADCWVHLGSESNWCTICAKKAGFRIIFRGKAHVVFTSTFWTAFYCTFILFLLPVLTTTFSVAQSTTQFPQSKSYNVACDKFFIYLLYSIMI